MCLQTLGVLSIVAIGSYAWDIAILCVVGAALSAFVPVAWLAIGDAVLGLLCAMIAFVPMATAPATRWVRADRASPAGAQAVLVLSSGLASDSALDSNGADRLLTGLELLRDYGLPRIVTTRLAQTLDGMRITSDSDQTRLIGLAGLQLRWIRLGSIASTRDEALAAAAELRPMGITKIAVVTSPMHTRRACAVFERVGFTVTCIPSLERDHNTRRPVTQTDRLAAWRAYLYERCGWVEYRWRNWV